MHLIFENETYNTPSNVELSFSKFQLSVCWKGSNKGLIIERWPKCKLTAPVFSLQIHPDAYSPFPFLNRLITRVERRPAQILDKLLPHIFRGAFETVLQRRI